VFCNFLVFSQLSFCFFLYEKRLVSLRRSPRFSTMIALFLYESLSACFQYFTSPFSLPTSSFLFCQNLSRFILSISFFLFPFYSSSFFSSHAYTHARIYYNVPPFSLLFSSFLFLCFTTPLQISVLQKSFLFIPK
jgi:hypothetical protein